jgi:hypothetical protein
MYSSEISALKIEKKANRNKFGDLPFSVPHFVQLVLYCVHLKLLAFTVMISL